MRDTVIFVLIPLPKMDSSASGYDVIHIQVFTFLHVYLRIEITHCTFLAFVHLTSVTISTTLPIANEM